MEIRSVEDRSKLNVNNIMLQNVQTSLHILNSAFSYSFVIKVSSHVSTVHADLSKCSNVLGGLTWRLGEGCPGGEGSVRAAHSGFCGGTGLQTELADSAHSAVRFLLLLSIQERTPSLNRTRYILHSLKQVGNKIGNNYRSLNHLSNF